MKTVAEKIYQYARETPEHLAAVFEDEELSYGELWTSAVRLHDYLRHAGVEPGDRIIFQSCYSRWFAVVCFAAHLCRAIFVPVEKNISPEALAQSSEQLEAKCVISAGENHCAAISLTYGKLPTCVAEGSEQAEVIFPQEEDYANVMFTTGTTGNPKGVIWTQKNITENAMIRQPAFSLSKKTVDLMLVPLNHAAPMWKLFANSYYGGTSIFLDGILKIKKMYAHIEKYGVNSLYLPPSAISVLQKLSSGTMEKYANRIAQVSIGSSCLNEEQRRYIKNLLPDTQVRFCYAASEFGFVSGFPFQEGDKEVTCVGKPFSNVSIRIVDEEMNDVPCGKVGKLLIRSGMNFAGYWNQPELTEQSFYQGYFVSSDAGYYDDEGNLYVVGRIDDMINIGGLKVYPAEIENEAINLKGITDCVCFPVEDKMTGWAVKMLLCREVGSALSLVNVRNHLAAHLDPYKIPKYMEFTDHVKRTANGKIDRKAYR